LGAAGFAVREPRRLLLEMMEGGLGGFEIGGFQETFHGGPPVESPEIRKRRRQ
jgi:hypothetical protein